MNKKITIILLIFVSSLTVVMLLITFSQKNKDSFKLSTERNFEGTLKLEKSINLTDRLSVMKPYDEKLYFVSWANNLKSKLFSFNLNNLNFEKEINIPVPNDSILIDNYFLDDNKKIITNKIKGSIITLDDNYKIINEFTYPKRYSRMAKSKDQILVSGWDDNYKIYFEKFDLKTKAIQKVQVNDSYMREYDNTGITLDGSYYANKNYIVNLPYSVNRAFVFNKDLQFEGKIDLIYKKLDFKYRTASGGNVYPDPNNLNPNLSGFIDDNNLFYVLVNQASKFELENKCFIDIYDIKTNTYVKSYKIGDYNGSKPRHIVIKNSKLYILFEQNINIYNFINE